VTGRKSSAHKGNRSFVVRLSISSDELLKIYRDGAREVIARSLDGVRVRFPASALQKYIGHDGVHGQFTLIINDANKLLELRRDGD
jgi:hypothetical protein